MGVITCDRKGCDNILSEYYIPGVGDVCRECMAEFKEYVKGIMPPVEGEYGAEQALKSFMHKPKAQQYTSNFDIDAWAEQYSRHKEYKEDDE